MSDEGWEVSGPEWAVVEKRFAQLEGLIRRCDEQIESCGRETVVVYSIKRRAGRTGYIRLFGRAGGPRGRVVKRLANETTAMFRASDVVEAGRRMLGRMILEWPWLLE